MRKSYFYKEDELFKLFLLNKKYGVPLSSLVLMYNDSNDGKLSKQYLSALFSKHKEQLIQRLTENAQVSKIILLDN